MTTTRVSILGCVRRIRWPFQLIHSYPSSHLVPSSVTGIDPVAVYRISRLVTGGNGELSWLHLAGRDNLATVPGDDPGGPERGFFSTRSPNRPNPIGLHPPVRLQVDGLEAVDGSPVIDLNPPIRPAER